TPHGPGFTRVTRTVGAACGTRAVVGCSAAGVLAGDEEVEDGPGIALLAPAGDVSARHFFVPDVRGRSETVADEIAAIVDREPRPPAGGTRLLAIFTDTHNVEPALLLGRTTSRLPGLHVGSGVAWEAAPWLSPATSTTESSSSSACAIRTRRVNSSSRACSIWRWRGSPCRRPAHCTSTASDVAGDSTAYRASTQRTSASISARCRWRDSSAER